MKSLLWEMVEAGEAALLIGNNPIEAMEDEHEYRTGKTLGYVLRRDATALLEAESDVEALS